MVRRGSTVRVRQRALQKRRSRGFLVQKNLLFVEVNVDYILMLVEQYREERGDGTDREIETLAKIRRAIDSSVSLRNKRDLILAFVDRVSVDSDVKEDWHRYVEGRRDEELNYLIADEGLDSDATRAFIERAFRNGSIPTSGAAVTAILPPTSRFAADDAYRVKSASSYLVDPSRSILKVRAFVPHSSGSAAKPTESSGM